MSSYIIHPRSEEHTSELQSHVNLVCRLLLEKKKNRLKMQVKTPIEHSLSGGIATTQHATPRRELTVCEATRSATSTCIVFFFFFNDPAPTELYPLPLHAALPI